MIYYFSGTGNSRLVVQQLAEALGEQLTNVAELLPSTPCPVPTNGVFGLVCPVHGWSVPRLVRGFLKRLTLSSETIRYTFVVLTCGDDVGMTHRYLRRSLAEHSIRLDAIWSVAMPNTYVALPGFDVDPEHVAYDKLSLAQHRLQAVAEDIRQHRSGVVDVKPGAMAWTKTYLIGPLFRRFLTGDSRFRVNPADCIACGRCSRACPVKNITMEKQDRGEGKPLPRWRGRCTDCLACYHHCPHHAISFGAFTRGKGRWVCPTDFK